MIYLYKDLTKISLTKPPSYNGLKCQSSLDCSSSKMSPSLWTSVSWDSSPNSASPNSVSLFSRVSVVLFYQEEKPMAHSRQGQLLLYILILTLRRPLRIKLQMTLFFDISKVKDSSFLKSDLTDLPPQIVDAHLLVKTDSGPSKLYFSVGFISRSCFE